LTRNLKEVQEFTQKTTCKGNVSTHINKLSTESFKSKSKNNQIVSPEHTEHLLHTRDDHNKDVDMMFKSFLNTHLRIFYSSFPIIKLNDRVNNSWSTMGIKISCLHKRIFYLLCSNDYKHYIAMTNFKKLLQTMLQNFDKRHKQSKKIYVQQSDLKLNIKMKTTWNSIKSETGRNDQNSHDGDISDNLQVNPDSFNNRIHDILACSAVPQPTVPPCAPAFISPPVNHIFNKSLLSGILSSHLKYSIIKLLFKKGDMNNMTN
jgi:hypothetical protein